MSARKRKSYWGNNPKYKSLRTSFNASTSNRFQSLSDLEDMDTSDEEGEIVAPKEKIPPVIVDSSHEFTSVLRLVGKNYKFKRMSIGTKIISDTLALYEDLIKKLKLMNLKFYTHQMKETKNFKLVLFGLHQISCKDISDEFIAAHNIHPVSVKEIKTKRSNINDALYMIEFNREHISKSEVKKIKFFYDISVFWRSPLKSSKGPTQCSKCSMYGHGARNCFRVAVCPACAGNHDHSECVLSKTQQNGPVIYKCYNCLSKKLSNVNHRADDPRCPCRKDYLEIRQRLTSRSGGMYHRRAQTADYHYNVDSHPQLPLREHMSAARQHEPARTHDRARSPDQPRTSDRARTYDQAGSYGRLYSDMAMPNNSNARDDISNERLLEIFFEAVDALQRCKNKYDKLRVLGMMLKHAI